MSQITVAALYKFSRFDNFADHRDAIAKCCETAGVMGTLLLAKEGINGTIAGPGDGITQVLEHLRAVPGFADLDVKFSFCGEMPFYRMKVRLKKEIVTMRIGEIDPSSHAGTYVEPADWNALISNPDVTVIDTRNDYEVEIGSFENALDPKTASFSQFPQWADTHLDQLPKDKPIAMFCTGGIRCEKATAFMRQRGYENVFHLKGGILKYLESTPPKESLWQGECFVFDQRTAVTHGLELGSYDLCHACRRPISAADKADAHFELGVSCPKCIDEMSQQDRARFRMRQAQIDRGDVQLGKKQHWPRA